MPDRRKSPFVEPECWHSFDNGQSWDEGRPAKLVEMNYSGSIRYRFAATPPAFIEPQLPFGALACAQ